MAVSTYILAGPAHLPTILPSICAIFALGWYLFGYLTRRRNIARLKLAASKNKRFKPFDFVTPLPKPISDFDLAKALPLPYRPFKHGHAPITMGLRQLPWDDWCVIDSYYPRWHAEKCQGLKQNEHAHVAWKNTPVVVAAVQELLEEIVRFQTHRYPSMFVRKGDKVTNLATNETHDLRNLNATEALVTAAKMTQEDIIMMFQHEDGRHYLDAGTVCLPGFWRLRDKFGMHLDELHLEAGVAQYSTRLQPSMERFFGKLVPEKPVQRNNFFMQMDDGLAFSKRMGEQYGTERITWAVADASNLRPEDMHFRSERQTLRRLPKTGAIAFLVRNYIEPVPFIAKEPHVPGRLAEAIRNWSDDVAEYKGRPLWEHVLLPYLDEKHKEQMESGVLEREPEPAYPF